MLWAWLVAYCQLKEAMIVPVRDIQALTSKSLVPGLSKQNENAQYSDLFRRASCWNFHADELPKLCHGSASNAPCCRTGRVADLLRGINSQLV